MLEDLLNGIMACWLVFYEYADHPNVDLDDDDGKAYEEIHERARSQFRELVAAEARAKRDRLACNSDAARGRRRAPTPPARSAVRLEDRQRPLGLPGPRQGHVRNNDLGFRLARIP